MSEWKKITGDELEMFHRLWPGPLMASMSMRQRCMVFKLADGREVCTKCAWRRWATRDVEKVGHQVNTDPGRRCHIDGNRIKAW